MSSERIGYQAIQHGSRMQEEEMRMSEHYDVIAIGGGSGGLSVVEKSAATYGKKCALIESRDLGGTCVNRGCVPKKVMWNAANFVHHSHAAKHYGFSDSRLQVDWHILKQHRDKYVSNIVGWYDGFLAERNIDHISGYGVFVDANTIAVNNQQYTAEKIVIAVGTEPVVPNVTGMHLGMTSDGFFDLSHQPQHVAIIGSGYIAVEFACMLKALGCKVTLIVRSERLISSFDLLLQDQLKINMQQQGITILENTTIAEIRKRDSGNKALVNQQGIQLGDFDSVIWAVGRVPQLERLNLEKAGVAINDAGYIDVNEHHETNVAHIYAIGDVIGNAPLTPVAIAAGRRLADYWYNGANYYVMNYDHIPSIVFTHPPIATMGFTEQQATIQYHGDIKTYSSEFTPMIHAFAPNGPKTAMKLVTTGTEEKIVGCHMIGDAVDEILQGFAVAISMGATKQDFDRTIAIHPTSGEELVTMR